MLINNKHIQGIFLYSKDVEYERGDFVVSNDCIYICTAIQPTDEESRTVSGINPEEDHTGNFKAYPGDMISSAQEYYNYINNITVWEYRSTPDEVINELNLGYEPVNIRTISSRDELSNIQREPGEIVRIEDEDGNIEYAFIPWRKDKYISGSVLNQILQDSFFGVNENGVITNSVNSSTDYSIDGDIAAVVDGKILNAIMKSPTLNNGMFNVSRDLPEIEIYTALNEAEMSSVLLKQYTYYDETSLRTRVRIQELIDPEQGMVYYRWSRGRQLNRDNVNEFNENTTYGYNQIVLKDSKYWISININNIGNTPGIVGSEEYWKSYDGEWSYDTIPDEWKSSYLTGTNTISSEIRAIRAYYTKKVNELEATRQQLTGAFCNRNVDPLTQDQNNDVVLTAGSNVRVHSGWEIIEGAEAALLSSLDISNFDEILSLFPSTEFLETYINPLQLGVNVVVRVGTDSDFTYSYYSAQSRMWVHGINRVEDIEAELRVSTFVDIFQVEDQIYTDLTSLPPDFPFTVILKNTSTNNIVVARANAGSATPIIPGQSRQLQRLYIKLSNDLITESKVADRLTKIYYEDLLSMDDLLSNMYWYNGNYTNVFVCNETINLTANSHTSENIPIPLIMPVEDRLYLHRSYFLNTIPSETEVSLANLDEEVLYISPGDPANVYSNNHRIGDKFILKYNSNDFSGKIYEAKINIHSGDTIDLDPEKIENWEGIVKSFSWKGNFYLSDTEGSCDVRDLVAALIENPYRFNQTSLLQFPSYHHGSLWQDLVFGPSDYDDTASKVQNYPKNSLVYKDSAYWYNTEEIKGSWSNAIIPHQSNIWKRVVDGTNEIAPEKIYIPDYNGIFIDNDWIGILKDSNTANHTNILGINRHAFSSISPSGKDIPGFFAIIYPSFNIYEQQVNCLKYIGNDTISDEPDSSFYAWFDFIDNVCYLRRTKNRDGKYIGPEELRDFFIFINTNRCHLDYIRSNGRYNNNWDQRGRDIYGYSLIYWKTEVHDINGNKIKFPFINGSLISNNISYFANTSFKDVGSGRKLNMIFSLNSKTTKKDYLDYIVSELNSWSDSVPFLNSWSGASDVGRLNPNYISFYSDDIEASQIHGLTQQYFEGNNGSLGLTSVQISPIFCSYLKNVVRIGSHEKDNYLYYVQDTMNRIWSKVTDVSKDSCLGEVDTRIDLDRIKKPGLGDYYYCNDSDPNLNGVYKYDYEMPPSGSVNLNIDRKYLFIQNDTFFGTYDIGQGDQTGYFCYNGGTEAIDTYKDNWEIYSSPKFLNNDPATEIPDERDNHVPTLSNHVFTTNNADYSSKVLTTLNSQVVNIVKVEDGSYVVSKNNSVARRPAASTQDDLVNIIKEINHRININNYKTTLAKYYLPYHVVADTSSNPEYTMEYRYLVYSGNDSAALSDWELSGDVESATLIGLSECVNFDSEVTYMMGDKVYYMDTIWTCTQNNTSGEIPNDESTYWTRYSILDSITTVNRDDILPNYNPSIRTICKSIDGNTYYINGNYWKCLGNSRPGTEYGYSTEPDYIINSGDSEIRDLSELPDAFRLGKVWAQEIWTDPGTHTQIERNWQVEQNNNWVTVSLSSGLSPSWGDNNYTTPEEALYDILHVGYSVSGHVFRGILYSSSKKYSVGMRAIYNNILWKCMCANNNENPHTPGSDSTYWIPDGDPIFHILSYVPSELALYNNIDPSVPFRLITKVGNPGDENYLVAMNYNQSSFNDSCIITALIYEQPIDSTIYKTYSITLDIEEEEDYYVTDNLILRVKVLSDSERVLQLRENLNSNTPPDNTFIKNIYYRYTL